jgi:hypothetical protein
MQISMMPVSEMDKFFLTTQTLIIATTKIVSYTILL